MSAAGKVCTGFSLPYVAKYANSGTTVTYSNVQKLARGVNMTFEPDDAGNDNNFYADNALAETEGNVFSGGTLTLTVDGLLQAAEALIMGLPTADSDGGRSYNDNQAIPYVGIGCIVRYMSEGSTTYVPLVFYKAKFHQMGLSAATQEDQIDWQTQELTADVMRSDMAAADWRYLGAEQSTESAAEAIVMAKLGASSPVTT